MLKIIIGVPGFLIVVLVAIYALWAGYPTVFQPSPADMFPTYFTGSASDVTDLAGNEATWKSTTGWIQFRARTPVALKDLIIYEDTDCHGLHLIMDDSPLGKERLASFKLKHSQGAGYEEVAGSPYLPLLTSSQCKKLKPGGNLRREEEREFLYNPATGIHYLGWYYR